MAEGPDGVTGVVPAPSLLRGMSSDSNTGILPTPATTPLPLERPVSRRKNDSVPEVKITVPESGRPSSFEGPIPSPQDGTPPEKAKARETKRARPPAETMSKELAAIGVDPGILGDRGGELVAAWEEFGWVGEGIRTKNIDQMKDEVERELNKIQAGGWLSRLEEEDDRIEAIKTGLDKCIEECEELDGLFTLYLVELGVSTIFQIARPLADILDFERGCCIHRGPITRSTSTNSQSKTSPGGAKVSPRHYFNLWRTTQRASRGVARVTSGLGADRNVFGHAFQGYVDH